MGAKHVMFTCAKMDATSFIIGNKIIDNKLHKLQNIYSCIISTENFNKIDINQGYTQITLICGFINLKNHNKVYIIIFVIKLPFQWYTKFQLNICYISPSLIQII
jgi:hypothetical protein